MEKECIKNAVETLDKFIGNAIVSILEVEELRAALFLTQKKKQKVDALT